MIYVYCCFTGHRPQGLPWKTNEEAPDCINMKLILSGLIDDAIADGYDSFYCGMAHGFDFYAAEAVISKMEAGSAISLHAAIPCLAQGELWNKDEQSRYDKILSHCTSRTIISPIYTQTCMLARNRFMVEGSERIIALWNGNSRGGTGYTLRYAKRMNREIQIIHLPDLAVTVI